MESCEGRQENTFSSSSLGLVWGGSQSSLDPCTKQERRGLAHTLPTLHNVFQSPLLTTQYAPCSPKGMRRWTLSLRPPGTSPTAALTAMGQLRRMRRGQRCTSPPMEETRCVIWSLRRTLDMTRTLRGKQSIISSLQMTRHRRLRLKGKLCIHRCSLTFR